MRYPYLNLRELFKDEDMIRTEKEWINSLAISLRRGEYKYLKSESSIGEKRQRPTHLGRDSCGAFLWGLIWKLVSIQGFTVGVSFLIAGFQQY